MSILINPAILISVSPTGISGRRWFNFLNTIKIKIFDNKKIYVCFCILIV